MESPRVVAVIPARYDSSRFPGKPLATILDRPMIQWVVEGVGESRTIDDIVVATDDQRIVRAVEQTRARPMMTSPDLPSGSDRVAEAVSRIQADVVVNVQGDEPLVRGHDLDRGIRRLVESDAVQLCSFCAPCPPEDVSSPDVVKVVLDRHGDALYFSRSPIPYSDSPDAPYLQHVGIYIFRRSYLVQYTSWDPSPLEQRERLEQLRVLERGDSIRMVQLEKPTVGVDRPEDIERVEQRLTQSESPGSPGESPSGSC